MVQAKAVIENVALTLTLEEANHLMTFLGQTQIFTVQDVLPLMDKGTQINIKNVLFETFAALQGVLVYGGL